MVGLLFSEDGGVSTAIGDTAAEGIVHPVSLAQASVASACALVSQILRLDAMLKVRRGVARRGSTRVVSHRVVEESDDESSDDPNS